MEEAQRGVAQVLGESLWGRMLKRVRDYRHWEKDTTDGVWPAMFLHWRDTNNLSVCPQYQVIPRVITPDILPLAQHQAQLERDAEEGRLRRLRGPDPLIPTLLDAHPVGFLVVCPTSTAPPPRLDTPPPRVSSPALIYRAGLTGGLVPSEVRNEEEAQAARGEVDRVADMGWRFENLWMGD